MLHRNWLFVSAACLAPLTISACSSDDSTPAGAGGSAGANSDASAAGGTGGVAQLDASQDVNTDAASETSVVGDAEAGAALAFVRLANLSPGVAALDICLRPRAIVGDGGTEAGATDAADSAPSDGAAEASDAASDAVSDAAASGFVGPILKNAGIPTGLAYSQVTAYLPIATGAYDVRVVAAGAASCAIALDGTPDATDVSAIAAGSYSTFAAIGLTTPQTVPAFQVKAYTDDHTVTAGQTKLRFIHASPGTPNLDIGLSTGESFVPLFGNVAYSEVGTGTAADAGVDANGYLAGPPITSQTLVARLTGDPTDVLAAGLTLPAGAIASTFAIGVVASVTTPVKFLICQDLDTSKAPLSNCTVKP